MKQPTNSKLRYGTLLALSQKPASSITSLAQELGILRASMSRAVKTLQAGGFIRREGRTLILTEVGQEELHRLMATSPKTRDIATRIFEQTLQQAKQMESWINSPTIRALESVISDNQYLSQAVRTFEDNSKILAAGTSMAEVASKIGLGTLAADLVGTSMTDVASKVGFGIPAAALASKADIGTSLTDAVSKAGLGISAADLVGTSMTALASKIGLGSSLTDTVSKVGLGSSAAALASKIDVGTSLTDAVSKVSFRISAADLVSKVGFGTLQNELIGAINATAQIQSVNINWLQNWQSENTFPLSHLLVENNAFLSGMLIDLEAIGKMNSISDMAQSLIIRTSEATTAYGDYVKGIVDGLNQIPNAANLELGFVIPTTTTASLIGSTRNTVESHTISRVVEKRDSTGTTRVRIYSDQYVAISAILENHLKPLGEQFVRKWHGAWQTLSSESEDRYCQAMHSGRELLMQVLAYLAPNDHFSQDDIARNNGRPPTRRMRIKRILGSDSKTEWVDKTASALDSTYDVLAAESHSREDRYRNDDTAAGELIVLGGLLMSILSHHNRPT